MKRELADVHAGDVWRDRDKRMLSGNRKVLVVRVERDERGVFVHYQSWAGDGTVFPPIYRSKYDRFRRAFDLVRRA